jgi:ClpX C4-type zinc finger
MPSDNLTPAIAAEEATGRRDRRDHPNTRWGHRPEDIGNVTTSRIAADPGRVCRAGGLPDQPGRESRLHADQLRNGRLVLLEIELKPMPDPYLFPAISRQLYQALEKLGAPAELLAVIGSWRDGSSDRDVLDDLTAFNATGSSFEVVDRRREWRELRCSFCSRRQSETGKLVAGPGHDLFICDQCLAICQEIVEADEKP